MKNLFFISLLLGCFTAACSGSKHIGLESTSVHQQNARTEQTNTPQSEVPTGIFKIEDHAHGIRFFNGLGTQIFTIPPGNNLLDFSSELIVYVNPQNHMCHLVNRTGVEVSSISMENRVPDAVRVSGNFFAFASNEQGTHYFNLYNSSGQRILHLETASIANLNFDDDSENFSIGLNYFMYKNEGTHHMHILGVDGQEVVNHDRTRYPYHAIPNGFFAYIEQTGADENEDYQLYLRNGTEEIFHQNQIVAPLSLSGSLIAYLVRRPTDTEAPTFHVRNILSGTEIFRRSSAEIAMSDRNEQPKVQGGFFTYQTATDTNPVTHVLDSNGNEIANSNQFQFRHSKFSQNFFYFHDQRTNHIRIFSSSGQVVINRPRSEIVLFNIVGSPGISVTENFIGFKESKNHSLHILNSSGQEVFHADGRAIRYDLR